VLHGAGDGRAGSLPLAIGIIEQLLSAVVLDIEVDIGRFRLPVDPHLGEKPLKQQSMAHRIDGGDAETVSHGGVRGAAAALTKNAELARLVNDVPHHEKEPGIPEPTNDTQLVIELATLSLLELAPAVAGSSLDALPQKGVVGVALVNREMRERWSHPGQVEIAAFGKLTSCRESFGTRGPAASHVIGSEESPASIGKEQSLPGCFGEREVGPESR
jgi:hypothetical protein